MEKNNNKIKLVTLVVLIVIAIIIVAIIEIILNKNTASRSINDVEEKRNVQIKDENQDVEYDDKEFSLKFLKMENKKENMVYSPLSIKYALHMLNDGANGNTRTQIENVIGNTNLVKYNNIENILSFANGVYIRETYSESVKEEYKNNLFDKYNAEIRYDAFKNANNINSWIENKTFGRIENMLQNEIVANPDNKMFLINALAIDMVWKDKFDGEDTHGGTFYLDNGNSMNATMMNKETKSDSASYYKSNNVTAISMDLEQYDSEQMEFIAIMPNDNLSDYVENFSINDFENITNNLTVASKTKYGLDISIPRFSFDYKLSLEEDLKKLGITDAFDSNLADFSNMSKSHLWVGGALHKANTDFTEKGIKAAAVTVIYMTDGMVLEDKNKPIEIKIDKPFMYLIIDKKKNEIWFVGTVYEPNSWENDQADYEYR